MTTKRLLLVDDEPKTLEFLAFVLKEAGHEIYFASRGADAVKAMKKTAFDLVLMDVNLPGMSGHEIAAAARAIPGYAETPILFLSGETGPESVLAAFQAGAQDYVTKPCCAEEVLARVRAQLELRDARAGLERLVQERTAALVKTVAALEREVENRRAAETRLERKNIALEEVLETLDDEKERTKLRISSEIETLVAPVIARIKTEAGSVPREQVELLLRHLDELFSPYAPRMGELKGKLSPQEYQVAAMIRNGDASKAIAEALSISLETVKWHRANIRKKLGLEERSANLAEHLANLGA